jgi:hypothetical protein
MPMYEIDRDQQGERYQTFRVIADDEETAGDLVASGEVEPQTEFFKAQDGNTNITELDDCDCDICERRGPWSCQEEEEDGE